MNYGKSMSEKFIKFCATYYFVLLGLTTLICLAIAFHKVFPIIVSHTVIDGTVVDRHIMSSSGKRGGDRITPIIEFKFENKTYRIEGRETYHLLGIGDKDKVIFNKSYPDQACEYSFMGFADFQIEYVAALLWFFLMGIFTTSYRIYTGADNG